MKGKRMKISMICYTLTGQQTGEKLKKGLEKAELLPETL